MVAGLRALDGRVTRMARARTPVSAVTMPEVLLWRNLAAFIDETMPLPDSLTGAGESFIRGWRKIQASRALHDARADFLAPLRVKPEGVSDYEFLTAHGLTLEAQGTFAARAIGL